MASSNRHIIQKQVLDLVLRENKDSYAIQQQIGTLFKEKINPLLDQVFSRLVKEETLIQIDHLEIEIGAIALADLDHQLPEKIVAAIEEKLSSLIDVNAVELKQSPVSISHFSAYLNYLEKGVMPWQIQGLPEEKLQQSVLEALATNTNALDQFRTLILQSPTALKRLVQQSEEAFFVLLLQACFGQKAAIESGPQSLIPLRKKLEEQIFNLPKQLWEVLFFQAPIRPRTFTITFWEQVLSLSLQEKEVPSEKHLIIQILKTIDQRPIASPQLVLIKKQIQKSEEPLVELKQSLQKVIAKETRIQKVEEPTEDQLPEETLKNTIDTEIPTADDQTPNETEEIKGPAENLDNDPEKEMEIVDHSKEEPEAATSKKEMPKEEDAADSLPEQVSETKSEEIEEQIKEELEEELEEQTRDFPNESEISEDRKVENTPKEIPATVASPNPNVSQGESFEEMEEGSQLYVHYAGLVMLHPFLKTFFEACDLLDEEDQFVNKAAAEKAVHLLHYLGSGETEQAEYHLLLSKFLCNQALNFPIDRKIEITDKEKEEGEHLLQTVINLWGALGDVYPDSLREGFLQREGKLEKRETGWCLIVEQKTLDILLGQLPWGFSMVKLPWMEELLRVEWA